MTWELHEIATAGIAAGLSSLWIWRDIREKKMWRDANRSDTK